MGQRVLIRWMRITRFALSHGNWPLCSIWYGENSRKSRHVSYKRSQLRCLTRKLKRGDETLVRP